MSNITYEYVIKNYCSESQLRYYEERARAKGLSEVEEKFLRRYANENSKILDIGTGCGRWAIGASLEGYLDITAIDMNPTFIEKAIEIANEMDQSVIYLVQNAESMFFSDNTFDFIMFSSDGFSQVPGSANRFKVLKEIARVLKPNGIAVIAVIDEKTVSKNDKDYYTLISKFRIHQLYEKYGFEDENDVYIGDGGYMHFAPIDETLELFNQANLEVIFHKTAESVLGYKDSKSCNYSRFFVATKE